MIFSHVLYQLSYLGICRRHEARGEARALYGLGSGLSSMGTPAMVLQLC